MPTRNSDPKGGGLRRREFLQLSAGAALASVAGAGASVVLTPRPAEANANVDVRVTVEGLAAPLNVARLLPSKLSMKKPKTKPKKAIIGDLRIELERGADENPLAVDGLEWVESAVQGNSVDPHRDIIVEILDKQTAVPIRTYTYQDCFPVSFSQNNADTSASGDTLRWTLEVRVNRIDMA